MTYVRTQTATIEREKNETPVDSLYNAVYALYRPLLYFFFMIAMNVNAVNCTAYISELNFF